MRLKAANATVIEVCVTSRALNVSGHSATDRSNHQQYESNRRTLVTLSFSVYNFTCSALTLLYSLLNLRSHIITITRKQKTLTSGKLHIDYGHERPSALSRCQCTNQRPRYLALKFAKGELVP